MVDVRQSDLTLKTCGKCGQSKPESEFYRRTDGKLRGSCKPCWNLASRAHQKANPERYRAYGRTSRAKTARWAKHLLSRWSLTVEQFEAIMDKQGGVCPICTLPPRHKPTLPTGSDEPQRFHVDHDHTTGGRRDLLCGTCNRLLGQAQEDPEILRRAADYLEQHDARQSLGVAA